MPETIADLLQRLRRQDYSITLTPEGRINARPPVGSLPEHIRAILTARKGEVVAALQGEEYQAVWSEYRQAVLGMVREYEARKPYTRYWVEARALNDLWYGVMPRKEDYDNRNSAALRSSAAALDQAVAAYFAAFDARCREHDSDAQNGRSAEQSTIEVVCAGDAQKAAQRPPGEET